MSHTKPSNTTTTNSTSISFFFIKISLITLNRVQSNSGEIFNYYVYIYIIFFGKHMIFRAFVSTRIEELQLYSTWNFVSAWNL